MQILFWVVPVAQRDDDVALDALWACRLVGRQFAFGDALGPVGEIFERHAAQLTGSDQHHVLAGLPRLDAADPRILMGAALEVVIGNGASGQMPQLMTADAAVVFHAVEVIGHFDIRGRVFAAEDLGIGGVDQTVAAHPDVVFGFRQIGDDITTLIVGDDDTNETHRQIVRFCDHPDAGLGAFGASDDAADVVAVNGDRGRLLRL